MPKLIQFPIFEQQTMVQNMPSDDEVTHICAWNGVGLLCATTSGRVRALLPATQSTIASSSIAISTSSMSSPSSTASSSSSTTNSQQQSNQQSNQQQSSQLCIVHEFQSVTSTVEQLVYCAPTL
jgi:hypothetical protein